jgi:predicted metal-dependent peptidase
VDWKKVLRYFVKTSQRANKSTTIKRINRRYPYKPSIPLTVLITLAPPSVASWIA